MVLSLGNLSFNLQGEHAMRFALGIPLLFCLLNVCRGGPIDLGTVDQEKAPAADEIRAPKSDDGVPTVGLHDTVKTAIGKDDSKHVYVLVNPISPDAAARKTWWVQREVTKNGTAIECDCQFGEEDQGKGEYFAIVAVVTGKSFEVGQTLEELPKEATYSKLRIVKRK
jgi:hypothetical protein